MMEFIFVYMSLLYSVILVGAVLFFTALALAYVYKLCRLMLNETWSSVITFSIAVMLIIFYLSLGVYFGEEAV